MRINKNNKYDKNIHKKIKTDILCSLPPSPFRYGSACNVTLRRELCLHPWRNFSVLPPSTTTPEGTMAPLRNIYRPFPPIEETLAARESSLSSCIITVGRGSGEGVCVVARRSPHTPLNPSLPSHALNSLHVFFFFFFFIITAMEKLLKLFIFWHSFQNQFCS